jgi:ferredoxin
MNYKNTVIYFMSGTGNTLRAAKLAGGHAREIGTDVIFRWVTESNPEAEIRDDEETMVGVMMPTHGFIAPWLMIKFACRLPRRKSTHAFVVATRAGLKFGRVFTPGISGSAVFLIALILFFKGFKVRGAMGVDMPSNWLSLHPGLKPENARAIVGRAAPKIERFMERILTGKTVWFTWNLLYEFIWMVLLSWISAAYLLIGRFFLAKLFFANNNCNGCGICAENCLVGAIKMRGRNNLRPFWRYNCESCMRCMSFCPTQAVEAGHSWLIILYMITSVPIATYLFTWLGGLFPGTLITDGHWIREIINFLYIYPALFISYYIFDLLLRIPVINSIFTYTTLTHIYRRSHEPDTKLKDLTGTIGGYSHVSISHSKKKKY